MQVLRNSGGLIEAMGIIDLAKWLALIGGHLVVAGGGLEVWATL
jgi:hypothetical protein